MSDPIEKIMEKEYLEENGWKDILEVADGIKAEKKKMQDKINKASEESIKSHADKLSENEK